MNREQLMKMSKKELKHALLQWVKKPRTRAARINRPHG